MPERRRPHPSSPHRAPRSAALGRARSTRRRRVPTTGFATIHVAAIALNTTPIWLGSKPRSRNNNARKGERAATQTPISAKSARTDVPARIAGFMRPSGQPGNEPRGVLSVYLAQHRVWELRVPRSPIVPAVGSARARTGSARRRFRGSGNGSRTPRRSVGRSSVPKHTRSGCSSISRRVARGCRPSSAIRAAMSMLKFGYAVSIRETHERSSAKQPTCAPMNVVRG